MGYVYKKSQKIVYTSGLIVHDICDSKIILYTVRGTFFASLDNTDEYDFYRKLTREEYANRFIPQKEEILQALQNKLIQIEGYHEMSNGWLYAGSLTDIAREMFEKKIRIIGYAPLMSPKTSFFGEVLDIGIVAEHEDGERFWCHASDEYRLAILAGDYDR